MHYYIFWDLLVSPEGVSIMSNIWWISALWASLEHMAFLTSGNEFRSLHIHLLHSNSTSCCIVIFCEFMWFCMCSFCTYFMNLLMEECSEVVLIAKVEIRIVKTDLLVRTSKLLPSSASHEYHITLISTIWAELFLVCLFMIIIIIIIMLLLSLSLWLWFYTACLRHKGLVLIVSSLYVLDVSWYETSIDIVSSFWKVVKFCTNIWF